MTEIRKYSKEWFASDANQRQKDTAKSLKKGDIGIFNKENFIGTKEEVKENIKSLKSEVYGLINEKHLVQSFGGADAIFDVLDANGDGVVTPEEIDDIAAVDTQELAKEFDSTLTSSDLQKIYENAVGGEYADVTKADDVEFYTYKDGSRTKLDKNEKGEVIKKMVMEKIEKGEVKITQYDYERKTKREAIQNNNHQIRFESIDNIGRANDKTTEIKYLSKGKKMTVEKTAGKTVTTIYDKNENVIFKDEKLTFHVNKKIEDTKQQNIGECWVLATVNALRETKGGKQLIKDAIKKNDDGTYTVELKGVNRSYTYTADEVGAHDYANPNKKLSTGDSDMHLIEMAITDYRKEIIPEYPEEMLSEIEEAGYPTKRDPLNSGFLDEAFSYLSDAGGSTATISSSNEYADWFDTIMDAKEKEPKRYAALVSFKEPDNEFTNGTITDGHGYTLKKVDKNNVYLINPWDSSKVIKYPRDKFEQIYNEITIFDSLKKGNSNE